MLPLASKMPTSRSSLPPEPYFRATPRVIECLLVQPLGAFRAMAWRWQPLCCWHAGAGGPSGSGWPGPTLPVYDAVPGAAPPTPTVGVPAANAVDAARPPEARSSESEILAQELEKLGEKVDSLETRLAEVERIIDGLETAARSTARALEEISSHWDSVYRAMRRAE